MRQILSILIASSIVESSGLRAMFRKARVAPSAALNCETDPVSDMNPAEVTECLKTVTDSEALENRYKLDVCFNYTDSHLTNTISNREIGTCLNITGEAIQNYEPSKTTAFYALRTLRDLWDKFVKNFNGPERERPTPESVSLATKLKAQLLKLNDAASEKASAALQAASTKTKGIYASAAKTTKTAYASAATGIAKRLRRRHDKVQLEE
jgi:hypothetical protein